jgi:hypothetical protein
MGNNNLGHARSSFHDRKILAVQLGWTAGENFAFYHY